MAQVEVHAGICGMQTQIFTQLMDDGLTVHIEVKSPCEGVTQLVEKMGDVNAFGEISWRGEGPRILKLAPRCLPHTACPVPSAMIKAVEVTAGLALPKDASIVINK